MATSYAVSAMIEKRAELAGRIATAERELRAMHESLAHLDATLRLFDPDIRPAAIKAKRTPPAPPVIPDLFRHVLDTLRMTAEPLTSWEIARAIIERLAVPMAALEAVDKAVGAYLRRQERKLVERVSEGRPARWRVRED